MWWQRLRRRTRDIAPLQGFLEGQVDGRITGWVIDRSSPGRPVTVTLLGDRGQRWDTHADVYRGDLQSAGLGDGHVAFSVPLARFDGNTAVRALVGDRELPGSPATLHTATPVGRDRVIGSLQLRLDPPRPARMSVSGWIYDRADPGRRCRLALRAADRTCGVVAATRFRSDLADRAVDGLHGFRFSLEDFGGHAGEQIELIDGDTGAVLARLRG